MSQTLASPYTALALDLIINGLLKGTLVLGLAGLATLLLRGTSAAARHAVWSLALATLLALPALELLLPAWKVEPLFIPVASQTETLPAEEPIAGGNHSVDCECSCDCEPATDGGAAEYAVLGAGPGGSSPSSPPRVEANPAVDAAQGSSLPTAAGLAILIWLLGAGFLLARLAIDAYRVSLMRDQAVQAREADRLLVDRLAASLGIRRHVQLLASEELSVPVTFGVWVPVVILPAAAEAWSAERKRVVLLHELTHIRRCDYAVHVMIQVVCALYWFNPLVWLAARLSNLEQERACDDQALHGGMRSDVYATHLVEIARAALDRTPRGAFAMAHPSSLASRVKSILARGLDRAPLSQRQLVGVTLGALSFAMPLASVDVWGVMQGASAVEQRIDELQDEDPLVRRYAAWALGELESGEGVGPLIERLSDGDADVRLVSAWALGEIKDDDAIEPLTGILDDVDPLVREMAVLSLGEIESTRAVDAIMNAVARHEELREPAFWALGEIGGKRAHDARHELFEHRGELGWENDQVWTGHLGTHDAKSFGRDVQALIGALGEADPDVRCSAAEHLGTLDDPQAVSPLLDTLRDPEPRVRAMAIWALDKINPSRRHKS